MQWGIVQNIARIDRGFHHEAGIPANHYMCTRSIRGRYLWKGSVNHGTIDRTKVLQVPTLRAVRSMRAVFCWVLR